MNASNLDVQVDGIVISNVGLSMIVPNIDIAIKGFTVFEWTAVPDIDGGCTDHWNEVDSIIGGSTNPWDNTPLIDGGDVGGYEPDLFNTMVMSVSDLNITKE